MLIENDTDLKFIARPGVWFVIVSVVILVPIIIYIFVFTGETYLYDTICLIASLAMVIHFLYYYAFVRIYVYKYHFVVKKRGRKDRQYLFREVQLRYIGEFRGGVSDYVIIDKNGKNIFRIGDYYINGDELIKSIKRNKAGRHVSKFSD